MPEMKRIDGNTLSCETGTNSQHGTVSVPESELWLSKHPEAKESVLRALEDLKAGCFCKNPPDIDAHEPWMDELED